MAIVGASSAQWLQLGRFADARFTSCGRVLEMCVGVSPNKDIEQSMVPTAPRPIVAGQCSAMPTWRRCR